MYISGMAMNGSHPAHASLPTASAPDDWRNLPPDPRLDGLRVRVLTANHHHLDHRWCADHAHDPFDRIYLVTEGSATLSIHGRTTILTPGRTYLIPALTSHRHTCVSSVTMYWCHLITSIEGDSGLFEHALGIHERDSDHAQVTATFRRLCRACRDVGPAAVLTRAACALDLLAPFASAAGNEVDQERLRFMPVLEAIEASGTDGVLSVGSMAALVGLSADRFSRRFSTLFGMTPSKYRQRRCLGRAQRLLAETDITIDAIARRTGFCDGFHLAKAFRRHLGTTPTAYRLRRRDVMP